MIFPELCYFLSIRRFAGFIFNHFLFCTVLIKSSCIKSSWGSIHGPLRSHVVGTSCVFLRSTAVLAERIIVMKEKYYKLIINIHYSVVNVMLNLRSKLKKEVDTDINSMKYILKKITHFDKWKVMYCNELIYYNS